ncbi:MAG: hypothetical protein NT010_07850 [Proteobacteria bacterium]|nr:hypothetical protein [Pseudomonadota bacterium]
MKGKFLAILMVGLFLIGMAATGTYAAIIDIPVTAAGDTVFVWNKSSQYVYTWWESNANPNQVSHWYYDGSGEYRDTYLSFNLSPVVGKAAEIISATFNFDILSIWGSGAVGILNGVESVYGEGGTGWKFFDVTSSIQGILANSGTTANYSFMHTGQSGFTFGSADGGDPAFLRITTNTPVPIPGGLWLLSPGLLGLMGLKRKYLG